MAAARPAAHARAVRDHRLALLRRLPRRGVRPARRARSTRTTTAGTGEVSAAYPCENADRSARTYTVDPRDYLRSMRDAESRGDEIIGVWHSHTHTDAYPSPTDVRQASTPRGGT